MRGMLYDSPAFTVMGLSAICAKPVPSINFGSTVTQNPAGNQKSESKFKLKYLHV